MFAGATHELCARAWALVIPAVQATLARGEATGPGGSLVALDPASPDGAVLFEATVGDAEPKTLGYARDKAKAAFRTGQDTSLLRAELPHLYTRGDIVYPGGVVRHGMVAAFSGVEGEADAMIAEWFLSAVRGLARLDFVSPGGPDATRTRHVGVPRED